MSVRYFAGHEGQPFVEYRADPVLEVIEHSPDLHLMLAGGVGNLALAPPLSVTEDIRTPITEFLEIDFKDTQAASSAITPEYTSTRPPLRDAYPTVPIDPLSIAPIPSNRLGQLYIDAREKYQDGMSLALASRKDGRPYKDIAKDYIDKRDQPGFSAVEFWDANFDTPKPDKGLFTAPEGMTLDEYTLAIRRKFIYPSSKQKDNFDIWLPYDRSVAGAGRFNRHSFLWDGYHMSKGYAADGRWDLVLNTVDNYEFEINTYGHGLNGSADFFATRPQPLYFSNEVSMLADEYGEEALKRYLPAMEAEYKGYWMDGREQLESLPDDGEVHTHRTLVRMPLGDGKFMYLNRFWDDADGPRLESYKEDVELGEKVAEGLTGEERQIRLKKLFKDLRAGAASGWDYSSRWLEDGKSLESINTTDVLPKDLNSLMARTEQMLARAHHAAGNTEKALEYEELFRQRVEAINKFNWDPLSKIYRDFNHVKGKQTEIVSADMAYPLYVGISNAEQTLGVAKAIDEELLFPGGVVATTSEESTQQWDGGKKGGKGKKNVWAPPNWAVARGLARMAHILRDTDSGVDVEYLLDLSKQVRNNYMGGVQAAFEANRTVPEKHNGDHPEKVGDGGEYETVEALAMVGEIWRAMNEWNPDDPDGCRPVGALALAAA